MSIPTATCEACKELFPLTELETVIPNGTRFCPDCLSEAVDQYEEHLEYLSNQD